MAAPQAMRTVWLALLCLIGLATTVIVKVAVLSGDVAKPVPSAKAEVSRDTALTVTVALSSENLTPRTKLQNNPSTKTDNLEVSNDAAPEVKSVKSTTIGSATAEPKQLSKTTERVVIRHWHDPLDKRKPAASPIAKGKLSKTAQSAEPAIATSKKMTSY